MKRLCSVILISAFFAVFSYSQDLIVQKNGKKIRGKIMREDSTTVYFTVNRNGQEINTFLNKSEIFSYQYGNTPSIPFARYDKSSLGIGLGMDYGGMGGSIMAYPGKNLGMFAGFGYALAGVGFNAGIKLRLVTEEHAPRVIPYILGMYGYNAVVAITNAEEFSRLFYGPTFGSGIDVRFNLKGKGYWTLGLLVPIRSSAVNDYINDLKTNYGAQFDNDLLPIAITTGYRIILR